MYSEDVEGCPALPHVLCDSLVRGMQRSLAEFENDTIQKQRQELQLLIAELRDRDRELNDMVATHQRQLGAWDQDRRRAIRLEERCTRFEKELLNRSEDVHALTAQLRIAESEVSNLRMGLDSTQAQLASIAEQHSQASLQLAETKEQHRSAVRTIKQLEGDIHQLEAREQELLGFLTAKDRDLSESSSHVAEISARHRRAEILVAELRAKEAELQRTVSEANNKTLEAHREAEHFKKQSQKFEKLCDDCHMEIQRLKQDLHTAKREALLTCEREKRKDQLLALQKSKQERTDAELTSLRELYAKQQQEMTLLQLNLESTKGLLAHRQKLQQQQQQQHIGDMTVSHLADRCATPLELHVNSSTSVSVVSATVPSAIPGNVIPMSPTIRSQSPMAIASDMLPERETTSSSKMTTVYDEKYPSFQEHELSVHSERKSSPLPEHGVVAVRSDQALQSFPGEPQRRSSAAGSTASASSLLFSSLNSSFARLDQDELMSAPLLTAADETGVNDEEQRLLGSSVQSIVRSRDGPSLPGSIAGGSCSGSFADESLHLGNSHQSQVLCGSSVGQTASLSYEAVKTHFQEQRLHHQTSASSDTRRCYSAIDVPTSAEVPELERRCLSAACSVHSEASTMMDTVTFTVAVCKPKDGELLEAKGNLTNSSSSTLNRPESQEMGQDTECVSNRSARGSAVVSEN
jgi:myosin heavy subunit